MVAIFLIQPLISNTHPPPILEDQLAGTNNNADASRRLTALLQRRFLTGTSEGALKSALLNQRFSPYRQGQCLPLYEPGPDDKIVSRCDAYDPNKAFE